MRTLRKLREITQGGLLVPSSAVDAGWARASVFRALKEEGWARLGGGVWAEPGARVDFAMRLRAVQLATPELVVSHRAAAWAWRIELLRVEAEFTDPGKWRRRTGLRVHRGALGADEVVEMRAYGGLRVTGVDRTLADLLLTGPRDEALVAVESALTYRTVKVGSGPRVRRAPLTRITTLASALDQRLRGVIRARAWLALADLASGSPAETIARLRMHDAGLRPETQAELVTPGGRLLRCDFLFRAEGVAVEIEGYAYHGSREDHRRDVARFNDLQQCAEVRIALRFTAEEVFHSPATVIATIQRALRSSGHRDRRDRRDR